MFGKEMDKKGIGGRWRKTWEARMEGKLQGGDVIHERRIKNKQTKTLSHFLL